MTKILTPVETRTLDDCKYVMLTKPFIFNSDVLKQNFFDERVTIPKGFVFDFESVPLIRGTSKRAGLCHDYLYRINSVPEVSKKIADEVYEEVMTFRKNPAWRRWIKYFAVKWFARSDYHRYMVETTYEEIISSE